MTHIDMSQSARSYFRARRYGMTPSHCTVQAPYSWHMQCWTWNDRTIWPGLNNVAVYRRRRHPTRRCSIFKNEWNPRVTQNFSYGESPKNWLFLSLKGLSFIYVIVFFCRKRSIVFLFKIRLSHKAKLVDLFNVATLSKIFLCNASMHKILLILHLCFVRMATT